MQAPFFSVIIPTLNRAERLVRAVRSVVAQDFQDFEIVIVDDGNDQTVAALAPYRERIVYLRGQGAGVAAARNLAIEHARGSWLAFLDADDQWHPQKLTKVAVAIRASPGTGLFYSRVDYVGANGERVASPRVRNIRGNGYRHLLCGDFIANSAAVVNKTCLVETGMFDSTLHGCEDWDLWIRIARHHLIWCIPETLVVYEYLSAGSFSARKELVLRGIDEVIAKSLRADPDLPPSLERRIRSSVCYVRGRVCLGAGDALQAVTEFCAALRLNPFNWRALVYVMLLGRPELAQLLPGRVRAILRLPSSHE